jgi:inosine-uridine nucleoside N-ribohydrolase
MKRWNRALLVALMVMLPRGAAHAATDVWLDVDVAAGLPDRDVDDALALIQAFHSPELKVRGVSAVFGNAPLVEGLPIAREVVEKFGPAGIAVHSGAASKEELGKENEAVTAIAAALKEKPLTILALGPVTNIGTLVNLHPELHAKIQRIVMVAARRPGQKFTYPNAGGQSFRDFNFESDPEAMRAILDTKIEIVFAPWEVSSQVWITPNDLARIATYGGAGIWIEEKCRPWVKMWQERFKTPGFNPFDTLAVGWVTHPKLIETLPMTVWIEEGPDDTVPPAEAKNKPYLLVKPQEAAGRGAVYAFRPAPQFAPLLMDRLSGY